MLDKCPRALSEVLLRSCGNPHESSVEPFESNACRVDVAVLSVSKLCGPCEAVEVMMTWIRCRWMMLKISEQAEGNYWSRRPII